jgi:hypothetical protein
MKSAVGGGREYPAADEREKFDTPFDTPNIEKTSEKRSIFSFVTKT